MDNYEVRIDGQTEKSSTSFYWDTYLQCNWLKHSLQFGTFARTESRNGVTSDSQ